MQASNGGAAQSAERFPYDVAGVRRSADDLPQKGKRLLVQVNAPILAVLETLLAVHRRFIPNIDHPVFAIELGSHSRPVLAGNGISAVLGKVGSSLGPSVQVGVLRKAFKCFRRRKVPHVVRSEILSRGGVADTASFVGCRKRQPRPLPFVAQPFLHRQRTGRSLKTHFAHVLNAHFGDDGELPNRLGVAIARDVPDALVPHMAIAILPSGFRQQRMHRRPSDFRVPEPKSGQRRRRLGPSLDVRAIPGRQLAISWRIPIKSRYSIRTVRNDYGRGRPLAVEAQGITRNQNNFRFFHAEIHFTLDSKGSLGFVQLKSSLTTFLSGNSFILLLKEIPPFAAQVIQARLVFQIPGRRAHALDRRDVFG